MKSLNDCWGTRDERSVFLIRFIVSFVFLMEGIQKFVYSEALGAGRFARIGIPFPEIMGPVVGGLEIVLALFLVTGLFVRWAALPALVIMFTAIVTTKTSVLLEKGFLTFAHDSRNDLLMIFCLLFLLAFGAGGWSADLHRSPGGKR